MSHHSTTTKQAVIVPAQRPSGNCPSWCDKKHHGEQPGQRSHWGDGATIDTASTPSPLLVDLNQVDGCQPLIVVTDPAVGDGRNLTLAEALRYATAILDQVALALPVGR